MLNGSDKDRNSGGNQEPVAVTYFGDREGSELIIFLSLIIVLRGN